MMRRWIVGMLAFCLMLNVALPPASAAETYFDLSVDKTTVPAGGMLNVSVNGHGMKDIYGYEVVMSYDSKPLTFSSAKNALPKSSASEQNGYAITPIQSGSKVTFAFTKIGNVSGISGDQTLAVFTFKAADPGEANVRLVSVKAIRANLTSDLQKVEKTVNVHIQSADAPVSASITAGTIAIIGQVDASGKLRAVLAPSTITEAIQKMEHNRLVITIKPDNNQTFSGVDLEFPIQPVMLAGDRMDEIVIDTGLSKITLSAKDLMKGLQSNANTLKLSIGTVDPSALPAGTRERIGRSTVLDYTLNVDNSALDRFDRGTITVEVPYAAAAGESADEIVTYHIAGDGNLEVVRKARYNQASGTVSFQPIHFSQYAAAYAHVPFADLVHVPWAQSSIGALAARDIVRGVGAGKFEPARSVTRAEFIQMLMAMIDGADDNAKSTFTDVLPNAWYSKAVASAQKLGIVKGKNDGSFGIQDPITRQDMAVMVYRVAQLSNVTLQGAVTQSAFTDEGSISGYALEALNAMQASGLITGKGNGKFEPRSLSTRAEAAVLIYRLFKQLP